MKTVDTRGRLCPEPLIMTRRTMQKSQLGEQIEVLTDNETARGNLMSYLTELGLSPACTSRGGEFCITFSNAGSTTGVAPEHYCVKPSTGGYVVAIAAQTMGRGDDALGALLMRGCINSLSELERLPMAIVIYNSGVKLAIAGTDTAISLLGLSDRGVRVVCCGTCVDFFELGGKLGVGEIGNMLLINELLSSAEHVIYP